ncbi:Uncharacterized protein SCF082_LOCUS8391 [Durusdinium trenchii]|uniref:Uncharacterized protein n=1 Tax=Durusdinium trenchii TaxID=1381693 RepID=A0ABP0IT47_9DINO
MGDWDVKTQLRFPPRESLVEETVGEFLDGNSRVRRRWVKPEDVDGDPGFQPHDVVVRDATQAKATLTKQGFELVQLPSGVTDLLLEIEAVGLSGFLSGPALDGAEQAEQQGKGKQQLEALAARRMVGPFLMQDSVGINLSCRGFLLRRGGPLGRPLDDGKYDGVANGVHIDQDLDGEPLKSLGINWLFQRIPFLHILNVWTPLHGMAMNPLTVMDVRTIKPGEVVRLRHSSSTNAAGKGGNFTADSLLLPHEPAQEWWWFPRQEYGDALYFYTAETPHSAFSVPAAEEMLASFQAFLGEAKRQGRCPSTPVPDASGIIADQRTPPQSAKLLQQLTQDVDVICAADPIAHLDLLDASIRSISRSSFEMRCGAFVVPYSWFGALVALALCCCAAVVHWAFTGRRRNREKVKIA